MSSGTYLNHSNHTAENELLPLAIKSAAIATGVVVAVELYRHRRLLAVAGAFTAALIWTNKTLQGPTSGRRYKKIVGSPSFHGESYSPANQLPADELEEALMESFPASDPPASHRR